MKDGITLQNTSRRKYPWEELDGDDAGFFIKLSALPASGRAAIYAAAKSFGVIVSVKWANDCDGNPGVWVSKRED